MQTNASPRDRRQFLQLIASLSTGALLAGCGGGGGTGTSAVGVVSVNAASTTPVTGAVGAQGSHPLNLALHLAYLGAQFYGFAARGSGLSTSLTSGIGQAGTATGARQANFGDPAIAGYAIELADDKQAHVAALRTQIGALAAAQPTLDLSTGANSAFARAAQGAGIVSAGAGFDPYASSRTFLLGALLIENSVAAAYRTLLAQADDAAAPAIAAQLADTIYHGGLVRALLDDKASADPTIDPALAAISAMFAGIDGSNVGDQTLAGATGLSANLLDADSRPIPFTRSGDQVLKALYLSSNGVGGFLPAGANGIPA